MATVKTAAKTARPGSDQVTASFEAFAANGQEQLREGVERSMAAVSEMGAFGKENVEAWIASATVASKGFEELSTRAVAYSKSALENHMTATKAIMGSKSVQELVERQSDYARKAFDAYVAEMTSMSEMWTGLTKDAMKPLNERVTAVQSLIQQGARR
jgi:phasin family protein